VAPFAPLETRQVVKLAMVGARFALPETSNSTVTCSLQLSVVLGVEKEVKHPATRWDGERVRKTIFWLIRVVAPGSHVAQECKTDRNTDALPNVDGQEFAYLRVGPKRCTASTEYFGPKPMSS
jgi:hypothetical protein